MIEIRSREFASTFCAILRPRWLRWTTLLYCTEGGRMITDFYSPQLGSGKCQGAQICFLLPAGCLKLNGIGRKYWHPTAHCNSCWSKLPYRATRWHRKVTDELNMHCLNIILRSLRLGIHFVLIEHTPRSSEQIVCALDFSHST